MLRRRLPSSSSSRRCRRRRPCQASSRCCNPRARRPRQDKEKDGASFPPALHSIAVGFFFVFFRLGLELFANLDTHSAFGSHALLFSLSDLPLDFFVIDE